MIVQVMRQQERQGKVHLRQANRHPLGESLNSSEINKSPELLLWNTSILFCYWIVLYYCLWPVCQKALHVGYKETMTFRV